MVVVSAEQGGPTVRSQNEARQAALKTGVQADPLVQAVLARFPGAEVVDVRESAAAVPQGQDDAEDAEPPPDEELEG
jgi:DNA polymerase-3 subunit gamma/tau